MGGDAPPVCLWWLWGEGEHCKCKCRNHAAAGMLRGMMNIAIIMMKKDILKEEMSNNFKGYAVVFTYIIY
jgi:hypothetical protein